VHYCIVTVRLKVHFTSCLSLSGLSLPFILTNLVVVMTFGVCILQDENEQVAVFHNDGEECQPICTHLFSLYIFVFAR